MDENDSSALSRRRVVGAVGIGMAVSAAAPAFAQNRDQSTSTNRSSEPVMDAEWPADQVERWPIGRRPRTNRPARERRDAVQDGGSSRRSNRLLASYLIG